MPIILRATIRHQPVNNKMKLRKAFFVLLLSSFMISDAYSQADTSKYERGYFGIHLGASFTQMNFSELWKYPYLVKMPKNSAEGLSIMAYVGKPNKIFATLWINSSYIFSGGPHKNYNISGYLHGVNTGKSYDLTIDYSAFNYGLSITLPVYQKFTNKILKGIYPSLGVQNALVNISSKAQGKSTSNSDTTFYLERSTVKSFLLHAEIMFELFSLNNKKGKSVCATPIAIKIGYNYQFQKPKWSGTYYRNIGDENPKVNLGGLYVALGINAWSTKMNK